MGVEHFNRHCKILNTAIIKINITMTFFGWSISPGVYYQLRHVTASDDLRRNFSSVIFVLTHIFWSQISVKQTQL